MIPIDTLTFFWVIQTSFHLHTSGKEKEQGTEAEWGTTTEFQLLLKKFPVPASLPFRSGLASGEYTAF